MSILPYARGEFTQSSPLLPVQRTPETQGATADNGATAQSRATEAARFAEQAGASPTRSTGSKHETDSSMFLRQTDTRQIVRQMYRMGRLKGQHAAFDMVFWQGDIAKNADQLLRVAAVEGGLPQLADRRGRDPFEHYLTLLEARELAGGADSDDETIQGLDHALDAAWSAHAEEILAGFNTAPALMRFAEQIDEWAYFRQLYATLVLNGEALAATFKSLLKRFGASRLRRAVKALRDAIAADLASPFVSADRARLVECQRDLEGTHTISSIVAESDNLCRRMAPEDTTPERVMDFVGGVFDFVSFNAYADYKLTELCALLVSKDLVTEKERNQVCNFLRLHVPLGLWSSLAVRENLFPAMFRSRL